MAEELMKIILDESSKSTDSIVFEPAFKTISIGIKDLKVSVFNATNKLSIIPVSSFLHLHSFPVSKPLSEQTEESVCAQASFFPYAIRLPIRELTLVIPLLI